MNTFSLVAWDQRIHVHFGGADCSIPLPQYRPWAGMVGAANWLGGDGDLHPNKRFLAG